MNANRMKHTLQIITSGSAYLDIDAYAGCIAYAELLNLQGREAKAVSSAPFNESITRTILSWSAKLDQYIPKEDDEFILIDISDINFLDSIVNREKIVEVIDHHPGFEFFWAKKLGEKADIEFIGACCTRIFERWQAADLLPKISRDSARLLATGILDNTLNLKANITTDRDKRAYEKLAQISKLSVDWPRQYFSESQSSIESNLEQAIENDIKALDPTSYLPNKLGQLVVWDAKRILLNNREVIDRAFESKSQDWILNLISINENRSYFVARNSFSQKKFAKLFGLVFNSGIATTDRLWLRKEIIRESILNE